jgi:hypothetical protein
MSKSINGVLNLDNIHSNFVLPLDILSEEIKGEFFIEIKYKNRVFRGSANEIFDSQYENYSLDIDLIDDFVNIYLVFNKNKELLSPISEYENQMMLDRLNNQQIDEDFLKNSKEFTRIIDK